jgi:hypothetical protein
MRSENMRIHGHDSDRKQDHGVHGNRGDQKADKAEMRKLENEFKQWQQAMNKNSGNCGGGDQQQDNILNKIEKEIASLF